MNGIQISKFLDNHNIWFDPSNDKFRFEDLPNNKYKTPTQTLNFFISRGWSVSDAAMALRLICVNRKKSFDIPKRTR